MTPPHSPVNRRVFFQSQKGNQYELVMNSLFTGTTHEVRFTESTVAVRNRNEGEDGWRIYTQDWLFYDDMKNILDEGEDLKKSIDWVIYRHGYSGCPWM